LVKQIQNPKTNSLADLSGHNTYVVYDHYNKKYYMVLLGNSHRYIAIAEDLTEMYNLLKEHAGKDKKSSQSVDQEKQPSDETEFNSLSEFALKALSTLNIIGKGRFNMPWRWR
jgi:hypothetical protein